MPKLLLIHCLLKTFAAGVSGFVAIYNGAVDDKRTSKFLSLVLRHKPEEIGIWLDQAGWVDVDTLLAAMARHGRAFTREALERLVESSDKRRFAFSEDGKMIRANQGHSVEVELGYEAVPPPAVLYHGTATRFIDSIRQQGLIKGRRHHVHLSEDQAIASQVGTRYGKLVLLVIDSKSMHESGCAFFVSTNGVWLTDHVPPQFISFPEA